MFFCPVFSTGELDFDIELRELDNLFIKTDRLFKILWFTADVTLFRMCQALNAKGNFVSIILSGSCISNAPNNNIHIARIKLIF